MVARGLIEAQPAQPTLGGVWHAWSLDPVILVIVIGAAVAYLAGVRRAGRDGTRWPLARTAAFLGPGLVGLVLVTMAWPAVYGRVLFSVRAVQLIVLLMVVPFLLALGRPILLAQTALPENAARRFDAILHSRYAKFLTVPVVSPLLLAVVPIIIYFTPFYSLTLTNPVAASACRVALLVIGLAVLLPLWEAGSINVHVPYALALFFSLIELLADAVPGIVLRLDTHVIAAGYYSGLGLGWGSSPLGDQHLGGDLLWCIGEAIDVPVLALLVIQWVRADARDAASVDLALDRAQAAAPAGPGPGGGGLGGGDPDGGDDGRVGDDGLGRPWWENDASVFGDRAASYQRRRR
jgi:putative copper resistance protein D